jgi:hypothetical protein
VVDVVPGCVLGSPGEGARATALRLDEHDHAEVERLGHCLADRFEHLERRKLVRDVTDTDELDDRTRVVGVRIALEGSLGRRAEHELPP